MVNINFDDCKNDTQKSTLVRKTLAEIIYNSCVEAFGEENVRFLDKQIEVGENASKIAKNSVVVKTGETINKSGVDVDICASITPEIKNFVEKVDKTGKITPAICWDDILLAIDLANE